MTDHEVLLIRTKRFADERGWFQETWSQDQFAATGIQCEFVQDNHSCSDQGVVRGLHYQRPPFAQAKLVRCIGGAILDVVVDLRRGASSYGQAYSFILSADGGEQLLVPPCFAHGFLALHPSTEVLYKVSQPYAPDHEAGLAWDDPVLGIDWGHEAVEARLSPRDRLWPRLCELDSPFTGSVPSRVSKVNL